MLNQAPGSSGVRKPFDLLPLPGVGLRTPARLLRPDRRWRLPASATLLALLLMVTPAYLSRHVRRLGFTGSIAIPQKPRVSVDFLGGTCVRIAGPELVIRSACLGAPPRPTWISAHGVTVYYHWGWYFIAY